jgi:hypothetical protein
MVFHGYHSCFPLASEVGFMLENELPIKSCTGQEVLDPFLFWETLKHVVYLKSLVSCTLGIGAIVIVDSLRFALMRDEFDRLENVCVTSS